jgi:hypothetical protein
VNHPAVVGERPFERANAMPARTVAEHLGLEVGEERDKYKCPVHGGGSLHAYPGEGRGFHCFACAKTFTNSDLAAAHLGVPPIEAARWLLGDAVRIAPAPAHNGNGKPTPTRALGTVVAEYAYTDESGAPLYHVLRFEPKAFRPRNLEGRFTLEGVPRLVLYNLAEVMEAVALERPVYLVEGEKDADRLTALGLTATTNQAGAQKWRAEYTEALRGAHVIILPDNDEAGRKHAQTVSAALAGVAASVVTVALPGLAPKGDVSDWLDAGGTTARLAELVEEARTTGPLAALPLFATLAELMARPELLAPPECVLPRIGYRGRLVLLAGPDKAGKSTLLGHGLAAVSSRGVFLGEPVNARTGDVVLVGLEEAVGDAVRRFAGLRADPQRVRLVTMSPPDVLVRLREQLTEVPADAVGIDSLTELARVTLGKVPDDGDNAGWAAVLRPLVAIAREHDTALILLHHVRRSDGQFRGAGEIAAAADAVLELKTPAQGEDPTMRHVSGRGRWPVEPFTVRLTGEGFEIARGECGEGFVSVDARVLLFLEANRGATKSMVRKGVGGRAAAVDAAVHRLIERGAVRNVGSKDRPVLFKDSGEQTEAEIGGVDHAA